MFNHEIQKIAITFTQITKLPSLNNLKKLKEIYISDNQISSIPEDFFSDNKELESINLKNNKISELPRTFLIGLSEPLRGIILTGNPIKSIPGNFFTLNEQLKYNIKVK